MLNTISKPTPRKNRIIVALFDQKQYLGIIFKPDKFRETFDNFVRIHPELCPSEISCGYKMKDIYLKCCAKFG